MTKQSSELMPDTLPREFVEADIAALTAEADATAMVTIGELVTPFGVMLAENVERHHDGSTEVSPSSGNMGGTNTVGYTGYGDNRDYQHDHD